MANGGIIGPNIVTSFGGCTVTTKTSSSPLTTQPGTRVAQYLVVAGGGGGGALGGGGGGAGGLRTCASFSVCGATTYPITVGAAGAAGPFPSPLNQVVTELLLYFQQLHQQVVEVELDIQHKHLDQVVQVVELQ
jgi:hypothetical protein